MFLAVSFISFLFAPFAQTPQESQPPAPSQFSSLPQNYPPSMSTQTHSFVVPPGSEPRPIIVNLNNNNTNSSSNSNTGVSANLSSNSSSSAHAEAVAMFFDRAHKMWEDIEIANKMITLKALAYEYRHHLGGAAMLGIYFAVCYHLHCATQYVAHKTVWASWQHDLSIKELLEKDINQLGKDLIIAIQTRYSNESNPTDFISPLVIFNIQVQQEIKQLQFYDSLYTKCKKLYITQLMPFKMDTLEALPKYIEHAIYTQTIFKNWAAHHNFSMQTQYIHATNRYAEMPNKILQKVKRIFGY